MRQRSILMVWTYSLPILLSLGVVFAPLPIWANVGPTESSTPENDEEVAKRRAIQHFDRGIELYETGEFKAALVEFELAFELFPEPELYYNIGVVKIELQDYAGAYRALRNFLDHVDAEKLTRDREKTILRQIEQLEPQIGKVNIRVTPNESEVRIDGTYVGVTPVEIIHNIGFAQIEVSAPGYDTRRERVRIEARSSVEVVGELAQTPKLTPEGGPSIVETKRDPVERRLLIGTWTMLGVGAAVGIGAVVTGILAFDRDQALQDLLDEEAVDLVAAYDRRNDIRNDIQALSLATDIQIGVAAAAGATALGLGIAVLIRRKRARASANEPTSLHVRPGPGGFAIRF